MPSIILSDNGVSSGSAGLKSTAASDGVLILQTTTSGGTATNAIVADNLQNVGVGGISPSTWSTGKAVEVGSAGSTVWGLPADIYLTSNTYYNAGWKYASGNAVGVGVYEINGLTHYWYGASSGSTGASVTLASKMVMDANTLSLVGLQGIKFQTTQSPSGDSNTLDDYEEGTWTPSLTNGGTLSIQSALYTKIGRVVTVSFYVLSINPTNNSSEFRIGGLPYNVVSAYYGGSFAYTGDSNLNGWLAIGLQNTSDIGFRVNTGSNAQRTNAQYITAASGSDDALIITLTYFTS